MWHKSTSILLGSGPKCTVSDFYGGCAMSAVSINPLSIRMRTKRVRRRDCGQRDHKDTPMQHAKRTQIIHQKQCHEDTFQRLPIRMYMYICVS